MNRLACNAGRGRPFASARRWLVALACSFSIVGTGAHATDASDLWWNANENGWGVNVSHQGDILFLTFFVYDRAGQPVWYSASGTAYTGTNASGGLIYQGALYQTSGPWLGGTYNASTLTGRQVGTVTFTLDAIASATLAYTVDGVSVSKSITRLTFRNNPNIAGQYQGGIVGVDAGCSTNGVFRSPATVTVTQGASSTTMALQTSAVTCTFTGTYSQSGRMGAVSGTVSCTNGARGTIAIGEIEATDSGLTARYNANYGGGCTEVGRFGGIRQ